MKRNDGGRHAAGRKQTGLTLIGFIIVLAVVGLFIYVGMKLVPMYTEFYSVKQALKGLSEEPNIAQQDPGRIKDLFFRRLYISYSENVKPQNVKIRRADNGWQMDVQYEVRVPLVFNLDVVGKFHATQMLVRGGDGV